MDEDTNIKPPVWFWVIAIVALLWNLMGFWDWYNSITMNANYLKNFDAEMLGYLKAMAISFGYQFMASAKPVYTGMMWVMTALIWAIAVFLVWFAKMAKGKGWLG